MLSFLFYIVVFMAAFFIGRATVGGPMPLTVYELQELRREKSNSARIHERIEKGKRRILDYAKRVGHIANDDVEELLLVSDSTARRYLNELETEGQLIQVGESGRGVYYTLPE